MGYFVLIGACVMMLICLIMGVMMLREKKPLTNPYVLLTIITFLLALRMSLKLLGIL